MAIFLTGKDLEEAIYDIIYNAKKRLLIISPFIKLDDYFIKLFEKNKGRSDLKIVIAFGKNKNNISKSFNLDDFEYFKQFPNISIVFVPNLHAKYYANERQGIITSINLYDYSFKNNIEFGISTESSLINRERLDNDAWETSMKILTKNNVVFVRKPNYQKKLLGKNYVGSETLYDVTDLLVGNQKLPKKSMFDFEDPGFINAPIPQERVSRKEFEETQKEYEKSKTYSTNKIEGHCIHCNEIIKVNPDDPYCGICFEEWKVNKNIKQPEMFCHICGNESSTSLVKPLCLSCYRKYKNKYSFSN